MPDLLSAIYDYCNEHELPPLTILVTYKGAGKPIQDFIARNADEAQAALTLVHGYNWSQLENPFGFARDGTTEDDLARLIASSPDRAADVYQRVLVRGSAQAVFRRMLMHTYEGRCAFCGLSLAAALQAAHIVPWNAATNEQRLAPSNGVLLCATHHALYDSGAMGIDSQGTVVCDKTAFGKSLHDIDNQVTLDLHGHLAYLPDRPDHRPLPDALVARMKQVGQANASEKTALEG